jgi:stage III sporulation protein AH
MVLKKQTVWLLTMLSLIVVLSVYYVTTPTQSPTAANKANQSQSTSSGKGKTENVTSSISSDDQFASLHLQRDQQQSAKAKELEQVIASDNSTATQVSDATSQLQTLNEQAREEKLLEDEIVAKGFGADAVIATDGDYATVYVNVKSLSSKQASQIMAMVVKSSLGVQFANVKYQVQNG